MPIIHLIIKHKNSILFDEGTPVDEHVTIDDFFTAFAIDRLEPELWDVDFEVHFGNTKIGNKEKVEKRCKVYEASKIYGIFVEIKIIDPNNNPNKEHIIIVISVVKKQIRKSVVKHSLVQIVEKSKEMYEV